MPFRAILPLAEAAEKGHYTLPPAITAALAVERSAARYAAEAFEARTQAQERGLGIDEFAESLLDALAKGDEPAHVEERLEAAERARRLAELRVEVATVAAAQAVARSDTVVAGLAVEVVREHLAPALDATVAAAAKLAPTAVKFGISDVDDSAHLIAHGDGKLIDAVRELDKYVVQYGAIRRARQHLLTILGAPAFDTDGSFSEFRRAPEAFGRAWNVRHATQEREWPAGPRGRLLWIAQHAARIQPWVPLPAEADAALAEHLREVGPKLIMRGGDGGSALAWYWLPPFNADPAPEQPARRRVAMVVR